MHSIPYQCTVRRGSFTILYDDSVKQLTPTNLHHSQLFCKAITTTKSSHATTTINFSNTIEPCPCGLSSPQSAHASTSVFGLKQQQLLLYLSCSFHGSLWMNAGADQCPRVHLDRRITKGCQLRQSAISCHKLIWGLRDVISHVAHHRQQTPSFISHTGIFCTQ